MTRGALDWRKHVTGALVALHLVALTLMAMPSPSGGLNRSSWKDPTVQGEFQAWTERFNGMGWEITLEELEERLWVFANAYEKGRQQVLWPFKPYYRYCGTWQSWRMFVAPHRYPARLQVEIREQGEWRKVYVARSEVYTWLGEQLDHDRTRSLVFRYGWRHYRRQYKDFADWVASRAAVDFPEADRMRIRFFKYKTLSPQQVQDGVEFEGEYVNTRVHQLAELR